MTRGTAYLLLAVVAGGWGSAAEPPDSPAHAASTDAAVQQGAPPQAASPSNTPGRPAGPIAPIFGAISPDLAAFSVLAESPGAGGVSSDSRVAPAVASAVMSPPRHDGIPATALDAYRAAADAAPAACGLEWTLLAAIGRIESDHGRYAGATLHADGRSSPAILGPRLDGVTTFRIPDTDHGRLDGDTVLDRAVGPLQFLPSTWSTYARDGNADGISDPQNLYDAAAAAAGYLCATGGDLRTEARRVRAVYAYNHSVDYVSRVLTLAAVYAGDPPPPTRPAPAQAAPAPEVPPAHPETPAPPPPSRPTPAPPLPTETPPPTTSPGPSEPVDTPAPPKPPTGSPEPPSTPTAAPTPDPMPTSSPGPTPDLPPTQPCGTAPPVGLPETVVVLDPTADETHAARLDARLLSAGITVQHLSGADVTTSTIEYPPDLEQQAHALATLLGVDPDYLRPGEDPRVSIQLSTADVELLLQDTEWATCPGVAGDGELSGGAGSTPAAPAVPR